MKKKFFKILCVVCCITILLSVICVPCFAIESSSSIINKTNLNLQSVIYTDETYTYNYPVSGFDYGTPNFGNNANVVLYGYNASNAGRIGVFNQVAYEETASFGLSPFINGDSNNSYYYPRMFYFGESYMPVALDSNWGKLTFYYDSTVPLEDIANEQIFISVTYQKSTVSSGRFRGTETVTRYATYNMSNNGRSQSFDIYSLVRNLITGGATFSNGIVHINSMKFTRVNSEGLLKVSSTQFSDLSYYSSDGDDVSPYFDVYTKAINGVTSNNELNVDFTTWITTAIGGFLNFELYPGLTIWAILLGVLGIMVMLAFLRYFAGG